MKIKKTLAILFSLTFATIISLEIDSRIYSDKNTDNNQKIAQDGLMTLIVLSAAGGITLIAKEKKI